MMRKTMKMWLMAAGTLITVGLIVMCGVMTVLKWDFGSLSTVEYATNEHTIAEAYNGISIVANTADIVFVPAVGTETVVTCYEQKNITHEVSVKDGVLTVEIKGTRKWYEYIEIINFENSRVTVALPAGAYGALSVKVSTGDVGIPKDFTFESIDVSVGTGNVSLTGVICTGDIGIGVSTGSVHMTDVTCKNLTSSGSTGDILLKNVIALEQLTIKRSTGDVRLDGCDAAEIVIETSTGDVEGRLCSEKEFICRSSTGEIEAPKNTTGGICRITTNTGDIRITVG